ncbi:MAG: hypothetical protein HY253_03390 [Burkholderiales bacterium]|nr:hypothetical protein [Burkholderiales bacterium]
MLKSAITLMSVGLVRRCLMLMSALSLSACASFSVEQLALKPFATDGCSLFPDRAYINKKDWCTCCVAHDLAYWRGGDAEARLRADEALRDCVLKSTSNKALAELMFVGVRAGGGPYFFTPYRWAYGWHYGRAYLPLNADETALADRLAADYLAKNPQLKCEGGDQPC